MIFWIRSSDGKPTRSVRNGYIKKYKKKHPSHQSAEADPVILSDVENSCGHKVEPTKLPIERNISCADKEIYFDLAGDFLPFNSHCELDPS